MIVIVSDEKKESTGRALYQYFKKTDRDVQFISASGRNIKPCRACQGCTEKTYGKCVFRDDMDEIITALMKADIIVYTSLLKWGSFSADIKKILDKNCLLGDPFYYMTGDGELRKACKTGLKKIVGIGVSDAPSAEEETTFKTLLKEMGNLMGVEHMAKVTAGSVIKGMDGTSGTDIEKLGKEIIKI